jgi:hypothetical protein
MTVGRMILIGAAFLGLASTEVSASPVSYDFRGTFPQQVFGSTQFSGTFTYDTNLPFYPDAHQDATHAYYAGADGTPIAMTLNLGSSQTNPLGSPIQSELVITHSSANDELNLDVTYQSSGSQPNFATIGMLNNNTLNSGPFTSVNPPSTLSLSNFNFGNQLILRTPDGTKVGTITSLTPTTVPEPATLGIFGVLAVGFVYRGRIVRSRSR